MAQVGLLLINLDFHGSMGIYMSRWLEMCIFFYKYELGKEAEESVRQTDRQTDIYPGG